MSGKGGSGKTSVCVTLSKILSLQNKKVLLIDGDTGTGGMTYYLGLNLVPNKKIGLFNYFIDHILDYYKWIQQFKDDNNIYFMGLGDHRMFNKRKTSNKMINIGDIFVELFKSISLNVPEFDYILIDCRGGIDAETLTIVNSVDDIILIVEPDTTSFQASQFVSEVLTENDLGQKINGFIINKVFDNPEAVARNGSGVFGGAFLGAIPFDLEAMRSFLVGDIPNRGSLYYNHIWKAFSNAFPEDIDSDYGYTLKKNEFNQTTIINPNAQIGNYVVGFLTVTILVVFVTSRYLLLDNYGYFLSIVFYLLVLLNISNFFKEKVGQFLRKILNILRK